MGDIEKVIFEATRLPGVFLVKPECFEDERGLFARTWCRQEFETRGLDSTLIQCSTSFNHLKGTLRGLHYQISPHAEVRLVRCTRRSIFDVAVDLRPQSPTHLEWVSATLTQDNRWSLYLPEGIAHGFQTLEDATEIVYQMSKPYDPRAARGIAWNDPDLALPWPLEVSRISEHDASFPRFSESGSW